MGRKLVYYVACTIDGFIARPDGSFDCFLFEGEHFPYLCGAFPETLPVHLRTALSITAGARRFDTVLMGRNTYEVGLREGITSPYAPLRQFVVSRSMEQSPDPDVELWRDSPLPLAQQLKSEPGKDIWLCGGAKLAGALIAEIDELILKINPVIIGQGIPLFEGAASTFACKLIEQRLFDNGFLLRHLSITPPTGK
ncbi:MAG: dihydrofolate reductase [Acidobacteria bacterium]|nr:dihydrofolate reductase [Acidobacteriota bacterium]